MHAMFNSVPSFLTLLAMWLIPTVQWCARPRAFQRLRQFLAPKREAVPTIRVADLQNRPWNRLALGGQKLQPAICGLHDRQQCDRTMFHRHIFVA
jgi:hypothetical protein